MPVIKQVKATQQLLTILTFGIIGSPKNCYQYEAVYIHKYTPINSVGIGTKIELHIHLDKWQMHTVNDVLPFTEV